MESLGVVLLLTVIPGQTGQDEVQVEAGVDATLDCQSPTEGTFTVLAWNKRGMKSDDYVFFYREDRPYKAYQHPSFKGRVELGDPQLKGGNMSIILHNTTDNDTGTYECHISYQSGSGRDKRVTPEIKHETRLTVVPAGQTGGQKKNEDNKDGGKEDTGKEDGSVGLIVGLVVSSVFLVAAAAGFLIYMKLQAYPCQNSYQPSGELQQV